MNLSSSTSSNGSCHRPTQTSAPLKEEMTSVKNSVIAQLNAKKTFIDRVDFALDGFTASDIRCQLPALLVNSSVKLLCLPLDRLDLVGAKCIAMMLQHSHSGIGPPIEELHLSHVHDHNMEESTCEGFTEIIKALGKPNTMMKKLVVSDTFLNFTEVSAISSILFDIKSLSALVLRACGLNHKGITKLACALASNTSLESLDISNNPIGNSGVSSLVVALEINARIKKLKLSGTQMSGVDGGNAIASLLNKNSSLEVLDLSRNHLGDIGSSKIAIGLKSNQSLHQLSLRKNSLSDVGALCFQLAVCNNKTFQTIIESNHTLRYLNVTGNNCSNEGVAKTEEFIQKNLPRPESLVVSQKVADFLSSDPITHELQSVRIQHIPYLLTAMGKTDRLHAMNYIMKHLVVPSMKLRLKPKANSDTVVDSFFSRCGDADNSTIGTEEDHEGFPDMIQFYQASNGVLS